MNAQKSVQRRPRLPHYFLYLLNPAGGFFFFLLPLPLPLPLHRKGKAARNKIKDLCGLYLYNSRRLVGRPNAFSLSLDTSWYIGGARMAPWDLKGGRSVSTNDLT